MTNQGYKLLPVEPTLEIHQAMMDLYGNTPDEPDADVEAMYRAAIAGAPEPVCRWTKHQHSPYVSFHGDCQVYWTHELTKFCPNCGRKVEVVGEVKSIIQN